MTVQIIVWEDKHATKYYDASTLEAWDASAIEILKELTDERYGGYMNPERYRPYITDRQRELAAVTQPLYTMPEQFQDLVVQARGSIERQERAYARAKADHAEALGYIEAGKSPVHSSPNGRWTRPMSWILLESRNGHEYEKFSLENVFTVREDA